MDAASSEGLRAFHNRTNWEPVYSTMPFDAMLQAEDDGKEGDAGDYELHQRMIGVKAFFRFLGAAGPDLRQMLKQLAAAGRAMNVEPFSAMTMREVGLMYGETTAAHSWRCKVLSGMIELAGMRGSKLPGQKSKDASASYRAARMGNKNRLGGEEGKHGTHGKNGGQEKGHKARQGSFLRRLHVAKDAHGKAGGDGGLD
jgi:hypothetical protein